MAYIKEVSTGKYYTTVKVKGLDSSYSYDGRYASFYLGNDQVKTVDLYAGDRESDEVTFSGLTPETEYTVGCIIYNIVDNDSSKNVELSEISIVTESDNTIGDPIIEWYKEETNNGFILKAYLNNLSMSYYNDDRIVKFALYYQGNYTPIETGSIILDAEVIESEDYVFNTTLAYDTKYVLGASIYAGGALLYDLDVVNVYVSSLSTNIVSATRQDDPRYADVVVYNNGDISPGFYIISQAYTHLNEGGYDTVGVYEISDITTGQIALTVNLGSFGKSKIGISMDGKTINEDYDVYDFPAISLTNSIDDDIVEFGGSLKWTISGLMSHSTEVIGIDFYIDDAYVEYMSIDSGSTESTVTLSATPGSTVAYGDTVTLRAEIMDGGFMTHIITRRCSIPQRATCKLAVSRDDNNPTTVYTSVWVNAQHDMSRIRIRNKVSGGTWADIENYYNPTSYPLDFAFYNMSTEKITFYTYAYANTSNGQYSVYSGYVYLDEYILEPTVTQWTWDDSNGTATQAQTINAFNALDLKLATSNFSYLVWNDLVEKVREAYLAKNGEENTVYEEYLNGALMNDTDVDTGKVLTATRFNNVRATIGGILKTFDVDDNAIYDHYIDTGNWDMQSGEQVLGAYITALTTKLNEGIDEI